MDAGHEKAIEAGKRADELIKKLAGAADGKTGDVEPDNKGDDPVKAPPVGVSPEGGADDKGDGPADAGGDPNAAKPATDGPGGDAGTDPQETKYQVLQGKYNAEIPALQRRTRDLESRLSEQMAANSELAAKLKAATEAAAKGDGPAGQDGKKDKKALDPEAYRDYGEEFQAVVTTLNETKAALDAANAEIGRLRGDVGQSMGMAAQIGKERTLDALVPDWREVEGQQAWHDWLAEVDPLSGAPRQAFLADAYTQGDMRRVAEIIARYRSGGSGPGAGAAAASGGQSAPGGDGGKAAALQTRLRERQAPSRSGGESPAGGGQGKRVWTRSEITTFYKDSAAGVYAGRDAERQRIDNDIIAATGDGRIVG